MVEGSQKVFFCIFIYYFSIPPAAFFKRKTVNNSLLSTKAHHIVHGSLLKHIILFMVKIKKSKELSKYMWSLKDDQIMSTIIWSIVEKVYGRTKINFCPLRLTRKVHLIEHFNDKGLLNKRNEFISGCRHQVKMLLKRFKRK